MDAIFTPNLDKLRNVVQSFGAHSFSVIQVAMEYEGKAASAQSLQSFEALLNRHAAVLGIQSVPGDHGLWRAA